MNIEDYIEKPQTMVKYDDKNANHREYMHQALEAYNYDAAECVEWFASMGIIVNPSQC